MRLIDLKIVLPYSEEVQFGSGYVGNHEISDNQRPSSLAEFIAEVNLNRHFLLIALCGGDAIWADMAISKIVFLGFESLTPH